MGTFAPQSLKESSSLPPDRKSRSAKKLPSAQFPELFGSRAKRLGVVCYFGPGAPVARREPRAQGFQGSAARRL